MRSVKVPKGVNQRYFKIEDEKFRMILAALKRGSET